MSAKRFYDKLPQDRLYSTRYDMWVQLLGDDRARIGATAFGLFLAGEVIAFTPKPRGALIESGRGLGTIETGKTVLAVHCPVSFELLQSNDAAEETPQLLAQDPYRVGWMIQGRLTKWAEEAALLVDAATYRAHCLSVEPAAVIE